MQLSIPDTLQLIASGYVANPRMAADGSVIVWDQLIDGRMQVRKFENGVVTSATDAEWHALADCSTGGLWHWSDPDGRTPDRLYLLKREAALSSARC
jgi:hypothetical protein